MDRPFREVHELYKILYQRAEAQQEAEKARKEKEKAHKHQEINRPKGINSYKYAGKQSSDASNNSTIPGPSPLEVEALEDALEDLM